MKPNLLSNRQVSLLSLDSSANWVSESYSFISPPFSHTNKLFSKPMHLDNMSLLCLLNKKKNLLHLWWWGEVKGREYSHWTPALFEVLKSTVIAPIYNPDLVSKQLRQPQSLYKLSWKSGGMHMPKDKLWYPPRAITYLLWIKRREHDTLT